MKHTNAAYKEPTGSEIPPSLNYVLEWISPIEKEKLFERMRREERQTMNLRLMPTAQFMVLKDVDNGNKIVGWAGFDIEHNPKFPEFFSQFIQEEYRTYLLGLVLTQARGAFVRERGFNKVYCRMEASDENSLFQFRKTSEMFKVLETETLDPNWVSYCKKCELFGKQCQKQAYLQIDIDKVLKHGADRIGEIVDVKMPMKIELKLEQIRSQARPPVSADEAIINRYTPKWRAA